MGFKISFFTIGILALFNSCVEKVSKQENLFWYVNTIHDESYNSDTLNLKVKRHDPKDTLIAQEYFEYGGKLHRISMFTNDLHAPIDGEYIYYELDSMGVFYSRSLSWLAYERLKSNNDSINNLIEIAIENLLLYEKFRCYDLAKLKREAPKTILFSDSDK